MFFSFPPLLPLVKESKRVRTVFVFSFRLCATVQSPLLWYRFGVCGCVSVVIVVVTECFLLSSWW